MIRRPPRSTLDRSSAASDVYKRQQQFVDRAREARKVDAERSVGDALRQQRQHDEAGDCLLYTSPSPRDRTRSRMPSSA